MDHAIVSGVKLLAGSQRIPSPRGARVVLAGGCFDVIHIGHVTYLEKSRAQGDYLVVAVESDEFIRSRKHRDPFHTQRQRAQILASLRSVDCVITLPMMEDEQSYHELVMRVKPHVITITQGDANAHNKRKFAASVSARVVTVNRLIDGLSSSTITSYARILHD